MLNVGSGIVLVSFTDRHLRDRRAKGADAMPVALLVANDGGHLKQLCALVPRMQLPRDRVWVTVDSAQTRSMLAGQRVQHLSGARPRDALTAVRNAFRAESLMSRLDVTVVVTTGSSLAVAVLPAAVRRGIECVYIESATRVAGPSLSGRVAALMPGVRTLTQHPGWASERWSYRGSVLDEFTIRQREPAPSVRRLVVTLGTNQHYGFRRLLERLVAVIPPGVEVLWQSGATDVRGLPIRARSSLPFAELRGSIEAADAVVAHGGTGSLLVALEGGAQPLLVPRRAARGEHVDDHQVQITAEAHQRGLAVVVEADDLTWYDVERSARGRAVRVPDPAPFCW